MFNQHTTFHSQFFQYKTNLMTKKKIYFFKEIFRRECKCNIERLELQQTNMTAERKKD